MSENLCEIGTELNTETGICVPKRGPGRPRKIVIQEFTEKRKPGRPKKIIIQDPYGMVPIEKRKPGRPKKIIIDDTALGTVKLGEEIIDEFYENKQPSSVTKKIPKPRHRKIVILDEPEEIYNQSILVEENIPEKNEKNLKTRNDLLKFNESSEYEHNKINDDIDKLDFLYPTLNDPNFTLKLSKHKEFYDAQYDGNIYDIKDQAEKLCAADFELMPHQIFIKNFLSFQTPYNSLLLYNGLGSGKTCSAIGVAEEMRNYMRQINLKKRIIIIASPDVQKNFMLQLFDDRKLIFENGLWRMNSCTGNALLNEINPTNTKQSSDRNLEEQKRYIVKQIRAIINTYYVFFGYEQFSRYFLKKTHTTDMQMSSAEKQDYEIKKIRSNFNNRLVIIDEVHNVRISNDNKEKKQVAIALTKMAKYSENMRLLLLSATPMYNTCKEIIWLANLMNINDKRSSIEMSDVFDKNSEFVEERVSKDGKTLESGKSLLQRKMIGYISYVRGENPYTFPYRIYPNDFSTENIFNSNIQYPKIQMNKKVITDPMKHLQVYLNFIENYQGSAYKFLLECMTNIKYDSYTSLGNLRDMPDFEELDSFSYNKLQNPIQVLNMVFPSIELENILQSGIEKVNPNTLENIISNMKGKQGIKTIMTSPTVRESSNVSIRSKFQYKPEVLQRYGRIFSREKLHEYSIKISNICNIIAKSKGIILIYSQYIDGGIIPVSLALEEMGFLRYGSDSSTESLFETPPVETIDSIEMVPKSQMRNPNNFKSARYVVITGDKLLSGNNAADLKYITNENNKNGELVKVVLISKTGAEGLDFKNIRQVHILDPWFNMNRIEQIIGRAVRNLSHCQLPFEERNVEIYLHSTILENRESEAADLYLYRLAEKKAIQIGKITRLLKEVSVDCVVNIGQSNFTVKNMLQIANNQNVTLNLSSGNVIQYNVGDRPYTDACDYMDNCTYKCIGNENIDPETVNQFTYNEDFLKTNHQRIMYRIQQLFREKHFYKRNTLINLINIIKQYPVTQIFYTLSYMIKNKNEYIVDKYGRMGNLVNKGEYYAFQPIEIMDENSSIFERSVPIDYKQSSLLLDLPKTKETVEKGEQMISAPVREIIDTDVVEPYTEQGFGAIIDDLKQNLDYVFNSVNIVQAGEKNWYKNTNIILPHLKNVYDIDTSTITHHVINHYLDLLLFPEKIILVKEIYLNKNYVETEITKEIKKYFDDRVLISDDKIIRGIVLINKDAWKIFILNDEFTEATPQDMLQFKSDLAKKMIISRSSFNPLVGFTIYKDNKMYFNIKDLTQQRNNSGARIDSAGKKTVIKKLNEIIGETKYTVENTKKTTTSKGISEYGLVSIFEIILRENNDNRKNGKIWYLNTEQAIFNNIEKI